MNANKKKVFQVYLPEHEHAAFKEHCKKMGEPMSSVCRWFIRKEIKPDEKEQGYDIR